MRLTKGLLAIIVFALLALGALSNDQVGSENTIYNFNFSIDKLSAKATLIFVGSLNRLPEKAELKKVNEDEYKINLSTFHIYKYEIISKDILRGSLKSGKNYIIADATCKTSPDFTPIIDNRKYIFFLTIDADKNKDLKEKDATYYKLVEGWHGMIALEKGCASKGAVRMIKEIYGIDVLESPESFIKALTLLITGKKPDKKSGKTVEEFYSKIARKQNQ